MKKLSLVFILALTVSAPIAVKSFASSNSGEFVVINVDYKNPAGKKTTYVFPAWLWAFILRHGGFCK